MALVAPTLFRSLTFLGTSSGVPTKYRNVSSTCLSLSDGRVWMFDCGEGTQQQLQRCDGLGAGKIDKIFVTHLHGDHSYGLPGLMCSISMMWQPPGVVKTARPHSDGEECVAAACDGPRYDHFSKASQYFELVGPKGLSAFLRSTLNLSEAHFGFQYRVTEILPHDDATTPAAANDDDRAKALHEDEVPPVFVRAAPNGTAPVSVSDSGGITVMAGQLRHPVLCYGYCLVEATATGAFLVDKALSLGVPKGPLFAQLKSGKTVTVTSPDGTVRTVSPDDTVGPSVPGRSLIMLGDTCDSNTMLDVVSQLNLPDGVDWIVHESTFSDETAALAVPRGHSTSRMAAEFAAKIRAKHLILTHFSARFLPREKDNGPMDTLVGEAVAALLAAEHAVPVTAAEDFMSVDLTKKKRA